MADAATLGILAVNLVLGVALALVGRVVWARRPEGPGAAAAGAFATWWYTLAALQLGGVLDVVVANTIGWSLSAYLAYVQGVILALVVALGALMYYMVYIFTGARGAWKPIAILYAEYFFILLYWIALARPDGLAQSAGGTTLRYANDLTDAAFTQFIGLLLIVPPILAALAYLTLFFRVEERSQKFRIAAIGGTFALWFGSSLLVGQFTDWTETMGWRIASAAITLAAAIVVYAAFDPPAWVRRRFALHGYGEHDD